MNIQKEQNGSELRVTLEGSLNTLSSPLLEEALADALDGIDRVVFDFSNLEYISSSGLRVLFGVQQALEGFGEVVIQDPNEAVLEILDFTGCTTILTVQ